jgi:hypothetical protein
MVKVCYFSRILKKGFLVLIRFVNMYLCRNYYPYMCFEVKSVKLLVIPNHKFYPVKIFFILAGLKPVFPFLSKCLIPRCKKT